jgi:hypothetical protein
MCGIEACLKKAGGSEFVSKMNLGESDEILSCEREREENS